MVGYFQSNRLLYMFWNEKMRELREQKYAPYRLLERIGEERNEDGEITKEGEGFFAILEERFKDTDKDWLVNLEQFVYQTCQTLYENATENITPFPPTWKDLLNELPFDNFEYDSFMEEYQNAKHEVIDNYRYNLDRKEKRLKKSENIEENLFSIITFLSKDIIGFKLKEEDFPPEFVVDKKYNNLSKKDFFRRIRVSLGSKNFLQILKERNLLERKLIQFFEEDLFLPHDWDKQLAKKADLDSETSRANNLQGQLTIAQNTIANAQTNLQVANLNALPSMGGKTLVQLIADSTAHATCSGGCPNPNHHVNYPNLQTKSGEYDRIHTKLSGKVSDPELQTLLDSLPNCPHSDYDTLKSENQTLKTENTQLKDHKCDCDSKVADKEKEIINKIITDLQLSTERERERERENILEVVITEIKSKINPPQDNSQLSQLQTQLKNKETEISQLKKGNQSQLDLEKLIAQKQAQNQELTTAKSSLESQLNEKQKELLTQVLNKSGEVKEKTIKEEIIKVIETSLTSQGIDSKVFRKEINQLSSLTDIEKSQGKYTGQKIEELKSSYKSATYLNYGLGILSIGSLSVLAYLLIRMAKKDIDKSLGDSK